MPKSTVKKQTDQDKDLIVYGKNSVIEALESDSSISKIWLDKDARDNKLSKIIELARQKKVPVLQVDKRKLENIAKTREHRSVVAQISPANLHDSDYLFNHIAKQDTARVLLPVNIQDPHNLGALIRSALAFDFDAVLISNRKSAQLNDTVVAASAGAALREPIIRIGNIASCIEKLKKEGFWIYGAMNSESAEDLTKVDFDKKAVILVGSEGEGIGTNLTSKCDFHVRIPIKFESLNVSVATGIILSHIYNSSND